MSMEFQPRVLALHSLPVDPPPPPLLFAVSKVVFWTESSEAVVLRPIFIFSSHHEVHAKGCFFNVISFSV